MRCKNCNSNKIIKKGLRKSKLQSKQAYQCKNCGKKFTLDSTKTTYPISIILKSISNYNLGYNLKQTSEKIEKNYKIKAPISTISSWINQYKNVCTFARLRKEAIKRYNPKNIINKKTLSHIQPYTFKYHEAKLDVLLKENYQFTSLKDYIEKINSKTFPHHIFTYNKEENQNNQRASQIKFNYLDLKKLQKNNFANKLTKLSLYLSNSNKGRHETIQNFFLINDSTTMATEIPVYLTNDDIKYFKKNKFSLNIENYETPITGHIDILQIRNGLIHILDYKPHSNKINPVEQLTIYALALASRTKLSLSNFKAAWFDENNYFEFYPLHAVYEKQVRMEPIVVAR